jgi:hypothetical protein
MWHAWERGETCRGLGGKARRKRPLERPRYRWKDRNRMDLRVIVWGGGGVWSGSTWLRIGNVGGVL